MSIAGFLCKLLCRNRVPEARMAYDILLGQFKIEGTTMQNVQLNTAQQVRVTARPMVGNRPATIQGDMGITVDGLDANNNPIVAIEIDSSNSSQFLLIAQNPGVATITVSGDADLDDGEVRTVADSFEVTVVVAEADRLELAIGDIEDQPPQPIES